MEQLELNQKQVKNDLEKWAKALRTIDSSLKDLQIMVHNLYGELNEVYKGVVE